MGRSSATVTAGFVLTVVIGALAGCGAKTALDDGLPERMTTDAKRLGQILRNLLGNAFKFTPEGGQVRVGLHESGTAVCLTVQDTRNLTDSVPQDPALLDRQARTLLADARLAYHDPVPLLPFFNLRLAYNTGAAFSFLGNAGGWQRWFFASISIIVNSSSIIE